MGLVIQSTAETLMPIAEAPPATAPAEAGAAAATGVFASMLASLAAVVESEASPLALDPSTLPAPGEDKKESDEAANAELLAALFPMTAPLPLVAQPLVEVVSAPEGAVANATAAAGVSLGEAPAEAAELPTEASSSELVADEMPVGSTESGAPGATSQAPDVAPASEAAPEAVAVQPSPPAPLPALRERGAQSSREGPAPLDEAPPTEATSDAASEATSVVRPVGNAETESNDTGDDGNDAGHGRKEGVERPQPRASASGIEHAAANSAVGQLREAPAAAPADAPIPAADAPQAAAPEIPQQVEQVATTVIETIDAGGGEARIHLDPVDLGEVTIHIRADGDSIRVEVRAERQEAAQLLRDHSHDLSQLLGERGLNLSDVNVGLGRGNNEGAWGQDNRAENRVNKGEFASIFGGDESAPLDIHHRLRAAYNPDGAHMYRV